MKAPLLVWALAVAFLLLVASLLIGSFTKPEFPPYELGSHPDSTYTLDASRGDLNDQTRDAAIADYDVTPAAEERDLQVPCLRPSQRIQ